MSRKSALSIRARGRPQGNSGSAVQASIAADFVEFHPSMSLEHAPTLADCLAVSSELIPNVKAQPVCAPEANETTLESVLANRHHVWTKVTEVIEKLGSTEAYQGDVHALQKLLQLHILCKQRETHLRTLQLSLMQEGRVLPRVEAVKTIITSDNSDNEDDKDITPPNTFHEWPEEQERHLEIVDYDAMDLIELSEHFS